MWNQQQAKNKFSNLWHTKQSKMTGAIAMPHTFQAVEAEVDVVRGEHPDGEPGRVDGDAPVAVALAGVEEDARLRDMHTRKY